MVAMTATHGVEYSLARSVSRRNGVGRTELIAVALDAGDLSRHRCRTWWGGTLPRDLVGPATVWRTIGHRQQDLRSNVPLCDGNRHQRGGLGKGGHSVG
jgi:hypothetical protein